MKNNLSYIIFYSCCYSCVFRFSLKWNGGSQSYKSGQINMFDSPKYLQSNGPQPKRNYCAIMMYI